MAKKPTTSKSRGDMEDLHDWLEDEIESAKDDAAVAILDLLKSGEDNRFEQVKNRIEECRANVARLAEILQWAEEPRFGEVDK